MVGPIFNILKMATIDGGSHHTPISTSNIIKVNLT